jgi:hypothetical protein
VRSFTWRVVGLLLGLALVTSAAQGQRRMRGGRAVRVDRPGVGPRVGYDFDAKHAFLGGQVNLPVGQRWALAPSADFYLGTTGTPYRLNVDVKYHPPTAYGFFYVGGGFALRHGSGNTEAGVNVFGGWEGRRYAPVRPFLEGRAVFLRNTSFNIVTGINFPL